MVQKDYMIAKNHKIYINVSCQSMSKHCHPNHGTVHQVDDNHHLICSCHIHMGRTASLPPSFPRNYHHNIAHHVQHLRSRNNSLKN